LCGQNARAKFTAANTTKRFDQLVRLISLLRTIDQ
jgi:hypothetical protein